MLLSREVHGVGQVIADIEGHPYISFHTVAQKENKPLRICCAGLVPGKANARPPRRERDSYPKQLKNRLNEGNTFDSFPEFWHFPKSAQPGKEKALHAE